MPVMHGHMNVVLGNRLKDQGLWKAGSVVSRGWGAPLVTMGECDLSFGIIPWAGRELTLLFRDKQELGLAVLIRKVV